MKFVIITLLILFLILMFIMWHTVLDIRRKAQENLVKVNKESSNMEDLVLSIEQCRYLQELGLDMSDAKLCWSPTWNKKEEEDIWLILELPNDRYLRGNIKKGLCVCEKMEIIPTYTLQEILEKLPSQIDWYILQLDIHDRFVGYYQANPELERYRTDNKPYTLWEEGEDKSILESVYKLLCWVLENGHLKVK